MDGKILPPLPTNGDAHARGAHIILMSVNPTIANHCHTEECVSHLNEIRVKRIPRATVTGIIIHRASRAGGPAILANKKGAKKAV